MRSRYGSAGNKDDRFDAYVLADILRSDRARGGLTQRGAEPNPVRELGQQHRLVSLGTTCT